MSLLTYYVICVLFLAQHGSITCIDLSSVRASGELGCNHTGLGGHITDERRLMKCLLDDYDSAVRPAANQTDTIIVQFNMVLTNLRTMMEQQHVLVTNGWMHHSWNDIQLRWNPENFSGIDMIRIPVDRIWTPEIVLYNTAKEGDSYLTGSQALVLPNGTVHWSPHGVFQSFCPPDFSFFPFDTQVCTLYFGSWVYDKEKVDLRKMTNDSVQFLYRGNEWHMVNFKSERHELSYDGEHQFPFISLSMTLKRVSSFYKYMFVAPTILTTILSLVVLLIPPSSGERFVLSSGVLIALTLILMNLGSYLPSDMGTVPLVAAYLSYNFILLVAVIIISTMSLNFQHRDTKRKKIPRWVKWILLSKIGPWLCVKQESYTSLTTNLAVEETLAERELQESMMASTSSPLPKSPTLALEKTLDEIRLYLKALASQRGASTQRQYENDPSHTQLVINEWMQLALVVDRLAFWCLLLTSVIVSIVMYAH